MILLAELTRDPSQPNLGHTVLFTMKYMHNGVVSFVYTDTYQMKSSSLFGN